MHSVPFCVFLGVAATLVFGLGEGFIPEKDSLSRRDVGRLTYPRPRRDLSVIDDYHGTLVLDAYRWLEDPDSEETKAFIGAQNNISESYLQSCPVKDQIKQRITEGMNYARYTCPMKKGDKYYYFHNSGLQNQNVLYVQDTLDSEPSVFFDPNELSKDGTIALSYIASFSKDGSLFAYGLSNGGSDWMTLKVKRAPSGEDLPDTLHYVKFSSLAWTHDNRGFFYSRFPESQGEADGSNTAANVNHTLCYHRLGTEQREDIEAFTMPNQPLWLINGQISDDGHYLMLSISGGGSTNHLYVVHLQALDKGITGPLEPVKLIDAMDHSYTYVTNVGTDFILKTNRDAALYRLIKIDLNKPQYEHWESLVPEDPQKGLLEWATCVHNKLVLTYLQEAKSELYIHSLETGTEERKIELELGSVGCLKGEKTGDEMFFGFSSFLTPGIIYRLDMTTYQSTVFRESRVSGFERENFQTEQVFYSSYDGTRVPMFVVHRKNLELSGAHPALLYGYGGFNVALTPYFDIKVIVFLQNLGGVYALANIRGGGEYGEEWHKNGSLGNKQNVFDDFQAAAEFLIDSGYTNRDKIAIDGASNGGLLVAACLNQRPDLFAAGIARVGVLDMLRFHLFTIGYAWVPEYGSSEDPQQFQWLYRYSPLHNIPCATKGGQYPATLLLTADKDDRVVPLHSLKFTATLQFKLGGNPHQTNPLLLRVDTDSGHGAGKPTSKRIEEATEIFSFLYNTLDLSWS